MSRCLYRAATFSQRASLSWPTVIIMISKGLLIRQDSMQAVNSGFSGSTEGQRTVQSLEVMVGFVGIGVGL